MVEKYLIEERSLGENFKIEKEVNKDNLMKLGVQNLNQVMDSNLKLAVEERKKFVGVNQVKEIKKM